MFVSAAMAGRAEKKASAVHHAEHASSGAPCILIVSRRKKQAETSCFLCLSWVDADFLCAGGRLFSLFLAVVGNLDCLIDVCLQRHLEQPFFRLVGLKGFLKGGSYA